MDFNTWVNTEEGLEELDKVKTEIQEGTKNLGDKPDLTCNPTEVIMLAMRHFAEAVYSCAYGKGAEEERKRIKDIVEL